jgi:hypothetical protein
VARRSTCRCPRRQLLVRIVLYMEDDEEGEVEDEDESF